MRSENHRVAVEPVRVSRNGKRFFSEAHKRMVVEKCLAPGASVAAVALAHGFNANLVRKWIAKHQMQPRLPAAAKLLPVKVLEPAVTASKRSSRTTVKAMPAQRGYIEIEIGQARVFVHGEVQAAELRVVLEALGYAR